MRLNSSRSIPIVRFRLTATMDFVGEIEEIFEYVLDSDLQGKEVTKLVPERIGIRSKFIIYQPKESAIRSYWI